MILADLSRVTSKIGAIVAQRALARNRRPRFCPLATDLAVYVALFVPVSAAFSYYIAAGDDPVIGMSSSGQNRTFSRTARVNRLSPASGH